MRSHRVKSAAPDSLMTSFFYLVSLALQVDVFLVRLHLHLLHLALQLAVGLLQAVVVSEREKKEAPRDHVSAAASCNSTPSSCVSDQRCNHRERDTSGFTARPSSIQRVTLRW